MLHFLFFLQEQIDALFKCVNQLQEQKADKNNVSTPLDVESIRKSLSRKVSTSRCVS